MCISWPSYLEEEGTEVVSIEAKKSCEQQPQPFLLLSKVDVFLGTTYSSGELQLQHKDISWFYQSVVLQEDT